MRVSGMVAMCGSSCFRVADGQALLGRRSGGGRARDLGRVSVSATATRYIGLAFDTCTAPTVAQMTAWKASPYRAIGIYIGGVNRGCAQPQLTAQLGEQRDPAGLAADPDDMG